MGLGEGVVMGTGICSSRRFISGLSPARQRGFPPSASTHHADGYQSPGKPAACRPGRPRTPLSPPSVPGLEHDAHRAASPHSHLRHHLLPESNGPPFAVRHVHIHVAATRAARGLPGSGGGGERRSGGAVLLPVGGALSAPGIRPPAGGRRCLRPSTRGSDPLPAGGAL